MTKDGTKLDLTLRFELQSTFRDLEEHFSPSENDVKESRGKEKERANGLAEGDGLWSFVAVVAVVPAAAVASQWQSSVGYWGSSWYGCCAEVGDGNEKKLLSLGLVQGLKVSLLLVDGAFELVSLLPESPPLAVCGSHINEADDEKTIPEEME